MDRQQLRSRTRLPLSILLVLLIAAGLMGAIYLRTNLIPPKTSASETQTSGTIPSSTRTTTSITSSTSAIASVNSSLSPYWSPQPYFNASGAYASLGYPKVTYDNYTTPYAPNEPNFILLYNTENVGDFQVGAVEASAVSLTEAVNSAAEYAKLDPSNFTLGEAVFDPGTAFNSTMISYPEWAIYFAQIHDGYWIYGDQGPYMLSVEVDVDALNGTALGMQGYKQNVASSGQYDLGVNASAALATVRSSDLSGVPAALTKNGTVTFMEPAVAIAGNYPPLPRSGLLWVVTLQLGETYGVLEGTFFVDAGTGALITGSAGQGLALPPEGVYSGSVAFSTADGLAISQQAFEANGSIIGRSGLVTVAVQNVLVVKPGSAGTVELNYTPLYSPAPTNVTLSLANPLPGYQNFSVAGSPPGVSLEFSNPTLALGGKGSTLAMLQISVASNAPSGTYLVEVEATPTHSGFSGGRPIWFLLSIWSGVGEWPPPPVVG